MIVDSAFKRVQCEAHARQTLYTVMDLFRRGDVHGGVWFCPQAADDIPAFVREIDHPTLDVTRTMVLALLTAGRPEARQAHVGALSCLLGRMSQGDEVAAIAMTALIAAINQPDQPDLAEFVRSALPALPSDSPTIADVAVLLQAVCWTASRSQEEIDPAAIDAVLAGLGDVGDMNVLSAAWSVRCDAHLRGRDEADCLQIAPPADLREAADPNLRRLGYLLTAYVEVSQLVRESNPAERHVRITEALERANEGMTDADASVRVAAADLALRMCTTVPWEDELPAYRTTAQRVLDVTGGLPSIGARDAHAWATIVQLRAIESDATLRRAATDYAQHLQASADLTPGEAYMMGRATRLANETATRDELVADPAKVRAFVERAIIGQDSEGVGFDRHSGYIRRHLAWYAHVLFQAGHHRDVIELFELAAPSLWDDHDRFGPDTRTLTQQLRAIALADPSLAGRADRLASYLGRVAAILQPGLERVATSLADLYVALRPGDGAPPTDVGGAFAALDAIGNELPVGNCLAYGRHATAGQVVSQLVRHFEQAGDRARAGRLVGIYLAAELDEYSPFGEEELGHIMRLGRTGWFRQTPDDTLIVAVHEQLADRARALGKTADAAQFAAVAAQARAARAPKKWWQLRRR